MPVTPAGITTLVVGAGFVLGFVFGLVAARTNFCTMGALSDVVNMGHWGRVRMWMLVVAVAVLGTGWLSYTGQVDLARSVAQRPVLPWLSLIVGGLCFGVGMTLAGGCVNKNLIRLGGGSLRSLVVLVVLAIAAYMTLKGLFGQWRASWLDPVRIDLGAMGWPDQGLGTALSRTSGLERGVAVLAAAGAVALALLAFVFKDARFRARMPQVLGGIALGALVVAGWYVTGHLGYGENPDTLETVYFATNTRTIESLS
ncbi:MAG TPA: YeeE/YedE family protein, partial [Burkholderiaceae bacterium]|nr:YeeE/YedE family protein [Burkholderiaceae bacterium]